MQAVHTSSLLSRKQPCLLASQPCALTRHSPHTTTSKLPGTQLAMADDDLFGFFNELKEVKPPAEEEAGGGGGGGKDEGVQHIGPANPPGGTGKRARGKGGFH